MTHPHPPPDTHAHATRGRRRSPPRSRAPSSSLPTSFRAPPSLLAHLPRPVLSPRRPTGVRKHARKTHMAWLKSVDENAGQRDRSCESKPSTYCVKEEGPFDDTIENELETSPGLTPQMGGMGLGGDQLPPMFSLPEAAAAAAAAAQAQAAHGGFSAAQAAQLNGSAADQFARSQIAAAAAANLLAHGAPPQTLAWLLAQQAAMQQSAMQHAALAAGAGGADGVGGGLGPNGPAGQQAAAIAAAAAALGLGPMPMVPTLPPWLNLHESLPPAPPTSLPVPSCPPARPGGGGATAAGSMLDPLCGVGPGAGSSHGSDADAAWTSDISALFASATGEEEAAAARTTNTTTRSRACTAPPPATSSG